MTDRELFSTCPHCGGDLLVVHFYECGSVRRVYDLTGEQVEHRRSLPIASSRAIGCVRCVDCNKIRRDLELVDWRIQRKADEGER